ncbi:hypothetical protein [Aeromonas diversa]|uniref:Uncharacterized protein n=1 Tax=Aeromonas diversa CDC 2478-85 TaxID=1268237 RepID=N9U0I7_9GAMM|nr:hypothetical protein [Aeromonas diversa]ENY71889.1 hypothetical protein G114_10780 [Aeromonas diversa CDC 2478-85]
MFLFDVTDEQGAHARIRVQALDWVQCGPVTLECTDDTLALTLLSGCRCDAVGFFNLLAGSKPLHVEQWLEYLREQGKLVSLKSHHLAPDGPHYLHEAGIDDEECATLLSNLYKVAGFNRLQLNRYLKHRSNPAMLATRYDQGELERYRLLNEVIRGLLRLKGKAKAEGNE